MSNEQDVIQNLQVGFIIMAAVVFVAAFVVSFVLCRMAGRVNRIEKQVPTVTELLTLRQIGGNGNGKHQ